MRARIAVGLGLVVLIACSTLEPAPIRAGDMCVQCKRPITNVKVAAAVVDTAGNTLKFGTVSSMATYLSKNPGPTAGFFVTDYPTGRMLRAQYATFVRGVVDEETRELDYFAFAQVKQAVEFASDRTTSPVDWLAIMAQIGAKTGK